MTILHKINGTQPIHNKTMYKSDIGFVIVIIIRKAKYKIDKIKNVEISIEIDIIYNILYYIKK